MRLNSKLLPLVGVIAVVVIAGLLLGWYASRPAESAVDGGEATGAAGSNNSPFFSKHAPNRTNAAGVLLENGTPATSLLTNWEAKVDETLQSGAEPAEIGKRLLALLPQMPPAGQLETIKHLANLTADDAYAPLGKLLCDPQTDAEKLEVLMADVMSRPNHLKLPLLLEVASHPEHPKAAEAKELLEFHLHNDYGTDWKVWQEKLGEWLRENPD